MDNRLVKLPEQSPRVMSARTQLQDALGVQQVGIAHTHVMVERSALSYLLVWLDTLDTLAERR